MYHLQVGEYRKLVTDCRACTQRPSTQAPTCPVFPAPRFGTGPYKDADLMIVGQNPPREPERCLHGAWMIHYPNLAECRGPHELLVLELIEYLGLTPAQVFATQAMKCPTPGNSRPEQGNIDHCKSFLAGEIRDVNPKVILAFGRMARRTVEMCIPIQYQLTTLPVQKVGESMESAVQYSDNIIYAPHPSMVDRFLYRESWFFNIRHAWNAVKDHPRPDTYLETLYRHAHPEDKG